MMNERIKKKKEFLKNPTNTTTTTSITNNNNNKDQLRKRVYQRKSLRSYVRYASFHLRSNFPSAPIGLGLGGGGW